VSFLFLFLLFPFDPLSLLLSVCPFRFIFSLFSFSLFCCPSFTFPSFLFFCLPFSFLLFIVSSFLPPALVSSFVSLFLHCFFLSFLCSHLILACSLSLPTFLCPPGYAALRGDTAHCPRLSVLVPVFTCSHIKVQGAVWSRAPRPCGYAPSRATVASVTSFK
jgi:hypothetical protein